MQSVVACTRVHTAFLVSWPPLVFRVTADAPSSFTGRLLLLLHPVANMASSSMPWTGPVQPATADVDIEGFIDVPNFLEHQWVVRLDRLEVQGNLSEFSDTGTPYCWIGLNLGRLLYYPTVNFQKFTPFEIDGCYDAEEGLSTVLEHHISLAYLPSIHEGVLEHLLRDLNARLQQWRDSRWNPQNRLDDFTHLRHINLLRAPLSPENITWQDMLGDWVTLKTLTVAEVEKLYDDRRFANTWEYKRLPGALHPEWFEIPGSRQEVMRLHATNALRWSQSESVVAATSRMPWAVKKPQQDAEWTRYTTCWLQHPTSLLRIPSELHEICFWILSCANHHPSLRSFHAIFNGKRDGSFKIQRLCDLHCTPQLSSNGLVAVQFCCPRLDAVLGR